MKKTRVVSKRLIDGESSKWPSSRTQSDPVQVIFFRLERGLSFSPTHPFKIEMPHRATLAWAMITEKPWKVEEVARLFMCVIATLCFGIFLAGMVEGLKVKLSGAHREFLQMVIVIVFFQGASLLWIALFLRRSKLSWREAFGLRPTSRLRTIAYGVTAGVLALPIALMLQWLSGVAMKWCGVKPAAEAAVDALKNPALSWPERIAFWVFAIVLAPVVEEALFRGILYPTIKQIGFPRLALWGTSFVFALMHANVEVFVPLTFLALIFVFLYESSGSLLAPIAAHCIFNAANVMFLIFAKPS
jgi:membrane protease YdiL (CAAX protease family)